MLDFPQLQHNLLQTTLAPVAKPLLQRTAEIVSQIRHGDLARWQDACDRLPELHNLSYHLDRDVVTVESNLLASLSQQQLLGALQSLSPWRKGPYSIAGIHIDTEWRSDWKWQRVVPHLDSLRGKRVLDVGCGNGYHVWRMLGAGADVVIGIDPGLLFNLQFRALQRYIQHPGAALLPLKLEQLPPLACFDTVFSMGVLYHRREPAGHLQELMDSLVPGGQLVLETLVVPADQGPLLMPRNRYARMRNVWQIPSLATLQEWMALAGLTEIRAVSENRTSTEEQRSTAWMSFESLSESLEPGNPELTVEGHPAPRRAVVIARKP